jgi:hypothetical protein
MRNNYKLLQHLQLVTKCCIITTLWDKNNTVLRFPNTVAELQQSCSVNNTQWDKNNTTLCKPHKLQKACVFAKIQHTHTVLCATLAACLYCNCC